MVRVFTAVVLCVLIGSCTRNPADYQGREGRVYLSVEIPVGFGSHRMVRITTWVEGYEEPFVTMLFDYRHQERAIREGWRVEGALSWEEYQGRPVDIVGMRLDGGTEVTVTVTDYQRFYVSNDLQFKIDGNVNLRAYSVPPENQHWHVVRTN